MCRWISLALLLAAWPSNVLAQYPPRAPPQPASNDPYGRRANRERAVALLGSPEARAFVESWYGDQACAAIFRCSRSVGRSLAEFHASGELDKLPKIEELLRLIGLHGNDVANFVLQHPRELQDPDCMEAFLARPLDIALGLQQLEVAGSEYRAYRLSARPPFLASNEWTYLALGAGVAFIALFIWYKRRKASGIFV